MSASQYPTCCHVLANGSLCQSPALKRKNFCYFHLRDRQRRDVLLHARHSAAQVQDTDVFDTLDLPVLEDANAIQVAASTVFHALGMRLIRPRRASLMLYALQIAHSNLPGVRLQPRSDQLVVQRDPEPIESPPASPREPPLLMEDGSIKVEQNHKQVQASVVNSPSQEPVAGGQ